MSLNDVKVVLDRVIAEQPGGWVPKTGVDRERGWNIADEKTGVLKSVSEMLLLFAGRHVRNMAVS